MINEKIRNYLKELSEDTGEDIVLLENQSYDNSIVGISEDYRLIYCYEDMIEELTQEYLDSDPELSQSDDELVREEAYENARCEAIDWIEYNTIRALPYLGEKAPIIMHRLEEVLI